jgi:hypothetical protein
VPQQPHAVLEDASLANEKYLVLSYLHNVQHKILIADLDVLSNTIWNDNAMDHNVDRDLVEAFRGLGKYITNGMDESSADDAAALEPVDWIGLPGAEEINLPVGCAVSSLSCRRNEPRIFFKGTGYTIPGRIYKYTFNYVEPPRQGSACEHQTPKTLAEKAVEPFGELSVWRESLVFGFEPNRWTVEQVWVPNPDDKVKIPMFIVRDITKVKSGDSFCLLYGYISGAGSLTLDMVVSVSL